MREWKKIEARSIWVITFFACLAALPMAGCGEDQVISEDRLFSQSSWPIINGDLPNSPEHQAVVSLHQVTGRGTYVYPFCSGTLVTPNVVVTAAHCLSGMTAKKVKVYVGDNPVSDYSAGTLKFFTVSKLLVHPSYDRKRLVNDIGLLRLSEVVPSTAAAPVPALPASIGFNTQDIGATLNFAGFGEDENGDYGVKLQASGPLGGLGCTVSGCPTAGVEATQISYRQDSMGPCFGDSGGPAFIYRENVPYLGGVTSYGDGNCTVYGVSTRVDAYEKFINSFIGL